MKKHTSILHSALISLILVLSLLLSACSFPGLTNKYTDVAEGTWYYEAVTYATKHHLVSGTSSTTFSPEEGMTRGQFIAGLRRAVGASNNDYKSSSSVHFTDVKSGSDYEQSIYWAVTSGIASGTGTDQFSPDQNLTRQEMAVIIQRAMDASSITVMDTVTAQEFNDASEIAPYAKEAVSSLQKKGLISGDTSGNVYPTKVVTRAEGTTVLVRLMQNATSKPDSEMVIPEYSGSPYVELNGNIPDFTEYEKKNITPYERYSDLDALDRCGPAMACAGRELMPTEEREEIAEIRPSGWRAIRYDDLIEDGFLYNRCHLLGFQLTGENANERNLITGTRYMNIEGMLPFENEVAYYIRRTGNHVLYRVTPIFEGSNLVCSGVKMEAYSMEDRGQSVQFNVFVFNVQPGIVIDYSDGYSLRGNS